MPKACIFVDGENFRFSLSGLFPAEKYQFTRERYLPDTDWHAFFKWIAERCDCELLRAYWYVTDNIDFRPHKMPFAWADKTTVFRRSERYMQRIGAATDETERRKTLLEIEQELGERRKEKDSQWKGQRSILFSIEKNNDRIEVRRSGSITFDLIENRFGTEKGVDTQLTTDLITMANMYDVAILVSGDADYLPPIAAIKTRGKVVYSVCFLNDKGEKLPGGARRLEAVVDSSYEVPFDEMLAHMGIRARGLASDPANRPCTQTVAATAGTRH